MKVSGINGGGASATKFCPPRAQVPPVQASPLTFFPFPTPRSSTRQIPAKFNPLYPCNSA